MASTLKLTGATPIAIAPSPGYARSLRLALTRLNASRAEWRRRMRRARSRSGQAGAALRLASAYRDAARAARKLTPPPNTKDVHLQISSSMSGAADDYRRVAAAARAKAPGSWNSRATAALSREQALQRALRQLKQLGYQPRRG